MTNETPSQEASSLTEFLRKIEEARKPVSPPDLVEKLAALSRTVKDLGDVDRAALEFEWTAFALWPRLGDSTNGWGTYFGPMMAGTAQDGSRVENPDLNRVTEPMIQYWLGRMNDANHPVLKARYADAAWDIGKAKFKKLIPVQAAQIAIDSYAAIARQKLEDSIHDTMQWLARALSIALSIQDKARIALIIDEVMALEKETADRDRLNTWGFCFDLLIDDTAVPLSPDQESQIVNNLESILAEAVKSLTSDKPQDPFVSKRAAERLARYYSRKGKTDDVTRVVSLSALPFVQLYSTVSSMQAHGWLEDLITFAQQYNQRPLAEKITVILQEMGSKVHDDMHEHSVKVEIPAAEIEQWIQSLLTGSTEDMIGNIATAFIARQKDLEQQVKNLAVEAPLMALIGVHQYSRDGQTIARVGSVEDDLSGRIVLQASQYMQLSSFFLHQTLEGLFKRMGDDSQNFLAELEKSPLFRKGHLGIIQRGIAAHYAADYLVSTHLLIPQIEQAFRELLKLCGRPIWKKNRTGGMDNLTLAGILSDIAIEKVYGIDTTAYLKTLLTDSRGWNLRNRVCHGMLSNDEFGSGPSGRALHVILILSMARTKAPPTADAAS